MPRDTLDLLEPDAHFRACLLRLIIKDPGCTLRDARNEMGLNHRYLLRYLQPMVDKGTVFTVEDRGRIHLLPAGHETCWRQAVAIRNPPLATLYAMLQQHGQMMQVRIIETAGQLFGWPRTATQKRLTALLEAGLAARVKISEETRAVWHKPLALHPRVCRPVDAVVVISIRHEQNLPDFSRDSGRHESVVGLLVR